MKLKYKLIKVKIIISKFSIQTQNIIKLQKIKVCLNFKINVFTKSSFYVKVYLIHFKKEIWVNMFIMVVLLTLLLNFKLFRNTFLYFLFSILVLHCLSITLLNFFSVLYQFFNFFLYFFHMQTCKIKFIISFVLSLK